MARSTSTMLGNLGSMLGLCWTMSRFLASELENNHTGTYVVPMLGNFGAMLGQCWANRCLCWAYVGPFAAHLGPMVSHLVGFMGFHDGKTTSNTKLFVLRVILGDFLGLCWANVGPFWVYVGPMLGHLVGFMGFHGSFWRKKTPPQHKAFCVEGYFGRLFGTMLGQCWAVLGLCWAHVGSFGGLYGVPWGSLEGKNTPQHKAFCVEGYFGRLFGTMLGQCWAVLGLCWANVWSFGGLYGVPWGGNLQPKTFRFRVFLAHLLPSRDFLEPSCHI